MINLKFKEVEAERNEVHTWLGNMPEQKSSQTPPFLVRTPEKVILVTSCKIRWVDELENANSAFVYDLQGYAFSEQKAQTGEWRTTLTPTSTIKLVKGEVLLSNRY